MVALTCISDSIQQEAYRLTHPAVVGTSLRLLEEGGVDVDREGMGNTCREPRNSLS